MEHKQPEVDEAGNTPLPDPDLPPAPTGEVVDVETDQPPAQNSQAHVHTDGGVHDPAAK